MWLFARGRPLTPQEHRRYQPYFAKAVLARARIVEGEVPFWLSRRMCAVVWYERIFFRKHAYQPDTLGGIVLMGHELMHVSQFLHGMTVLSYLWSCRYGYRNSRYEVDARAKEAMIAIDYGAHQW